MEKIKKQIDKRIKELKKHRDTMTGSNSKTKYNFAMGELYGIRELL